jgi:hypothetical protein
MDKLYNDSTNSMDNSNINRKSSVTGRNKDVLSNTKNAFTNDNLNSKNSNNNSFEKSIKYDNTNTLSNPRKKSKDKKKKVILNILKNLVV